MVLSKQSSVPAKAFLHRLQLVLCRAHSVAPYISQISGSTLPVAVVVKGAGLGLGLGGVGVHLKISAVKQAGGAVVLHQKSNAADRDGPMLPCSTGVQRWGNTRTAEQPSCS